MYFSDEIVSHKAREIESYSHWRNLKSNDWMKGASQLQPVVVQLKRHLQDHSSHRFERSNTKLYTVGVGTTLTIDRKAEAIYDDK